MDYQGNFDKAGFFILHPDFQKSSWGSIIWVELCLTGAIGTVNNLCRLCNIRLICADQSISGMGGPAL